MQKPDIRGAFPSVRRERAKAEISADVDARITELETEVADLRSAVVAALGQTTGAATNGPLAESLQRIAR